MDDSLAETGLAGEMLAEVDGIVIARQFGKADDVLVLHGLAQRLAHPDRELFETKGLKDESGHWFGSQRRREDR